MSAPALWLGVWGLWFSLEHWVLGPFSYLHVHDNADQMIPLTLWHTESWRQMLDGPLLPVLSGVDRLAPSGWIKWIQLPFLVFPPWVANGLNLALLAALSSYFTFRLARDVFGVDRFLAVVLGMAYPLMPFELGELRLMHLFNEPGLPFLLWVAARFPMDSWRRLAGWALGSGCIAGLGMDLISAAPFFLSTAFGFALIVHATVPWKTRLLRAGVFFAVFTSVYVLPSLPTLFALLENGPFSHRSDWVRASSAGFFIQAWLKGTAMTLLGAWWAWPGILAALFLKGATRSRSVGALYLVAVGALAGPATQFLALQVQDLLGFLRGFTFLRYDRVLPLALLVVTGVGLQALLGRAEAHGASPGRGVPVQRAVPWVLLGVVLCLSYGRKAEHWDRMRNQGQNYRTLYGSQELAQLEELAAAGAVPARCATAGASFRGQPMFLLARGLETADGYLVMYPNRYQKFWDRVIAPLVTTEAELAGHFSQWGSRVHLFHSRKEENASLPEIPFAAWYNLDLLSLINVTYFVSYKPVVDDRLARVPPVLSREVRRAWARRGPLEKVWGYARGENPGRPVYVYENPEALPRFFTAGETRVMEDVDALYDAMAEAGLPALRDAVWLAAEDVPASMEPVESGARGRVDTVAYSPAASRVEVTAEASTWLVFSNQYYPWWRCRVNGEDTPIVRAYGAFMAVRLPPGTHRVEFDYDPPYGLF